MSNNIKVRQIIRKVLKESFDTIYFSDDLDLDIYYDSMLNGNDYFTLNNKCSVKWMLDVVEKEKGIISMNPVIKEIILNIEIFRDKDEKLENFVKKFENLSHNEGDYIDDLKLSFYKNEGNGHLFPTSISIHESVKEIEINFDYL